MPAVPSPGGCTRLSHAQGPKFSPVLPLKASPSQHTKMGLNLHPYDCAKHWVSTGARSCTRRAGSFCQPPSQCHAGGQSPVDPSIFLLHPGVALKTSELIRWQSQVASQGRSGPIQSSLPLEREAGRGILSRNLTRTSWGRKQGEEVFSFNSPAPRPAAGELRLQREAAAP